MKKILLFALLILLVPLFSAVDVLFEDFEAGTIPDSWTQEYVTGSVNWLVNNGGQNDHPPAAYEGNFNAWFFDANVDGNSTRLISPEFSLITNSKLSFWYCQDSWTSFQDYMKVYYRTGSDEPWTLLLDLNEEASEWEEVIIDLPEPSETYSLAFEAEAYWGYGVCIDNILVQDCVMNILVWDNDNNSDYTDPNTGQYHNCEYSITSSLDELAIEYTQMNTLPGDLSHYDIVMIELGLYCVG